ncbi:MAG: hypothetical protein MUF17_01375 [Syntrophales bacterium]|jgi:hypothetical protein|nr:hypothetical protein [Syntrophales bacterium]MCU0553410.1 hypothetical protein [Syntrophales bacterium]
MEPQEKACVTCREKTVFALCLGCGAGVCDSCAQFELIGSGCGCVWPAYYCSKCAGDPLVNPNAAFRDPPKGRAGITSR